MAYNLRELFNAKDEQEWFYLTHNWGNKGVHAFLKNISPKVNVIAQLGFELAYFEAALRLEDCSTCIFKYTYLST